jgi:hypothetical protein
MRVAAQQRSVGLSVPGSIFRTIQLAVTYTRARLFVNFFLTSAVALQPLHGKRKTSNQ